MRLLNVDDLHRFQNYGNTVTEYTISVVVDRPAQQHIVDAK